MDEGSRGQLELIAGAAMLYVGGRAAAEALARGEAAPGARAVGHWLPIAAVAGAAVLFGQSDMALTLLFSSSIAAIALVGGCVAIIGTTANEPEFFPEPLRKAAAFLLPAAVLAYLSGFAGEIGWLSCALLACQGAIALCVWFGRFDAKRAVSVRRLMVAAPLCVVGAWAAIHGATRLNPDIDYPPSLIAAATILAPLLAAPMLLSGSMLAQRGQAWAAHGTHIGVAQLNLCAGLPLAALLWRIRRHEAMAYPMHIWRVDAIVMVLLAAALLPATAGRWRPGRMEGFFLVGLYIAYVLAVVVVALR